MKKIITLFAVWMMAVMAFAQNYGILITNTSELVSATRDGYFLENETTPYEQYLAHVNLSVGDRCKLYDQDNRTAWIVPLDEYSTSDIYLDQTNNEYVCAVGGCFDFYIKLRYNEDKLYIGAGSGCTNGTTPQGNDPVGEDISQEEEDDLTLCINDQQLYALSSGALSFSLYDSLGNLVNMVYAGSDDDGAVRYDMSGLATGRYTLVVNDDSYIFDHNLPLNITTSQQEGSNCTSYYVYSEAYVDSGQVYLYNCSRMTEPGLVEWNGLSVYDCDSTVVFNLLYNLDEPQEETITDQATITAQATITVMSVTGSSDTFTMKEGSMFTSSFDNGYDVAKIINTDTTAINLYTYVEGTAVSRIATNDLTNTELVFDDYGTASSYTMTFSNVVGTISLYDLYNDSTITLSEGGSFAFSGPYMPEIGNRFVINRVVQYYIGLYTGESGEIEWHEMTQDATIGTWEYTGAYPGGGVCVNRTPQTNELMSWFSEESWVNTGGIVPQVGDTVKFSYDFSTNTMTTTWISSPVRLGICVNDENLYIWGQEEINPIVYDADGNFVSLVVLEQPQDGGTVYDVSTLSAGRYTMYLNNTSYLFDRGLQGPTTTSWDAETGCAIDSTTITVYMQQGETYLYGCDRYTEPTDIQNTYTAVNECDSIVLISLQWAEEEPQPQEEERRICLSHKKLMITELNNSTPMLLDSAGQQVTMPVEGYPMENAIQYDLTSFGRGRYTLIVDSDTLLFDFGTETTTSYTQEGQDCPTYNSVINATIKQGQTYLFICDKKTEPGTYRSMLSNMTQCDSMVVLYLSFEEDEIPCEPDTTFIDAMICEGEAFTWRGEEFTDPGTYELTVQQHGGCDSVYIINLSVNPTYFIEEIVSVREDKLPYIWNEQEITQSGEYFAELSTVLGCDSIIALRLTVTQLPIYSVTAIADHGFVNGTGTYPEGTEIYLEAQADEGFAFQMWSDGTTENPKNFILTRDTTLRALFYMPEVEQEVVVDSIETNSVTITWDTVAGAVLYELRIYKNGMLVVTYQVDRDNNIINQIFTGPDRLVARRDSTGGSSETLQVSVGGLEPGQDYTYSLDAMDDDRSYVGAQSGTFTTEEEPVDSLDALFDDRRNAPRKVISNGRLYIEMPDGTRYDATGQELIRN